MITYKRPPVSSYFEPVALTQRFPTGCADSNESAEGSRWVRKH